MKSVVYGIAILITMSAYFYYASLTSCSVDKIFINRHSSRAMSGAPVPHDELMTLFGAARLAPSSFNDQPWRFIYARKGTPAWQKMFDLLVPFNQAWVGTGDVLILIVSHNNFEHNGQFSRTHSFDTGAAMENLALQGSLMGLVIHGMAGFDYDRARVEFNIPEDYTVEAMFVVGKPGKVEVLTQELQEKEVRSPRKSLSEIIFEGAFTAQ
ncbi:MAG: nitroreductase family protein [Candidatus Babeliaceae bacterium]